jgi:hypothetical protein
MAGLVPAIHAPMAGAAGTSTRVDARVEPGHDDPWLAAPNREQPNLIPRTALRFRGNDEEKEQRK